jgi:hypothetical protein
MDRFAFVDAQAAVDGFENHLPSTTITQLRKEARTVEELIATIPNAGKRKLSPYSRRRVPGVLDFGWAAGLLDGEGCVHLARQTYAGNARRRPTYRLSVSVAQTRLSVLQEFEWIVGITGTYTSQPPRLLQRRTCHSLIFGGMRAYVVLEQLHSLLRRKQPQAELARRFREECDIHQHPGPEGHSEDVWDLREWYHGEMSKLNRD